MRKILSLLLLPLVAAGRHGLHPRRHRAMARLNQTETGWSLYTTAGNDGAGCYVDQSQRLVPFEVDLADCLSTCEQNGYLWASKGEQCFCGSSLGSTLTSVKGSECHLENNIKVYKYSRPLILPRASSPDQWTYQGCTSDNSGRVLDYEIDNVNMSPGMCISACSYLGYVYAGLEFGTQCFCGNSLGDGAGYLPESACNSKCATSMRGCGGGYALALWQQASAVEAQVVVPVVSSVVVNGTTVLTTVLATSTSAVSTAASSASVTTSGSAVSSLASTSAGTVATASATAPASTGYQPSSSVPSSGSTKYVWAHHMVGNTYPYAYNDWMSDINLAQSAGIDGFVLNIGTDWWQQARVADAYSAAQNAGFKMMLSLDMSVFSCGDGSAIGTLQTYLKTYVSHPAAAKVNGLSALTTFGGEGCTFGQSSTNAGWAAVFGNLASSIYFMPAYFGSQSALGSYSIQGGVNWDSAWPMGASDVDTGSDWSWMGNLGGKGYIATISPLFNTHLSYKNWIYRSDDWLFAMRWEQVIGMRSQIDQVEIITWNDYGESHYIGPIAGGLPAGSEQYANSDFPHTDILSLNAFYASAWKNGYYPTITYDQAWVMARPHPAGASASSDPYGLPTGASNSQDNFYAQVHLTSSASVTLCSGSCKTFSGNAGINRFSLPLQVGSGMSVKVVRSGQTTVDLSPNFTFNGSPALYNFNYLIKSS